MGVYAISEDADMITKEKFFTSLSTVIDEIGNSRELIITGDFNSRIGKQLNNRIVGPFGENVVNDNGERLIELCQHQSLKILNDFFKHKDIHKFTRYQDTLQQKSIIDYVIVRQSTKLKIQDVRTYRGTSFSDHFLVNSRIVMPNIYKRKTECAQEVHIENDNSNPSYTPIYNLKGFEDESTKFLYKKKA